MQINRKVLVCDVWPVGSVETLGRFYFKFINN